ncbi:sugar phosphate nucleotidyltransferase [Magnetococcus sp. PR-3]|uniref:sugar phosphate nucleotidyltransferase n=1 Tax=Magnetococcus sp. PR-3 TaxID=3120355 RepID=UPI002FCE2C33
MIVLAGGKGTRIRGVLGEVPKLLAPLDGQPYLQHLLAWLYPAGFRHVQFALGYQAHAIETALQQLSKPADLTLDAVIEAEPLGTAGAIRLAMQALPSGTPLAIMNGDSYTDADLAHFYAQHRRSGASISMLCVEVEDISRYGQVVLNDQNRVVQFAEKNPHAKGHSGLINAGLYILEPQARQLLADSLGSSIEHDFFTTLPEHAIHGVPISAPFIDFGTPESYQVAQTFFAQRQPQLARYMEIAP